MSIEDGFIDISPEDNIDSEKFNLCNHRSDNEEVYTVQYCCGIDTGLGYRCLKFNIANVRPHNCFGCAEYQLKESRLEEYLKYKK